MSTDRTLFHRYAEWIIRYRIATILMILLVTGFLVTRIFTSLQFDMDPDIWAPQAHPYVKTTNLLEEVFGGRNVAVIGIVPKQGDVYQPAVLEKIQRIQQGIEQIPQAIRHNILSFAARKVKEIKGTPGGMEVRPMMETIPRTPEEIAHLKAAVASLPIYINALVSPDGNAAAVIADFKMDKQNPTYTPMYHAILQIVDRERDDTVDIYLGGFPVMNYWFEFHMMKMPMFFGAALLIIMAIQYWSFRSVQGMLLPMLTAIFSVIWGLGLMGLLGVHMDPMNTTTPILIMAVAAGHAIQILKRYYEEYHRLSTTTDLSAREANRQAVTVSLARVGPVMITAGLIAVVTFFSLTMTGIIMVQHFGVFTGSGILGAMVLELTLIPAVRSLLSAPKIRETERERRVGVLDRVLLSLSNHLVGGRAAWILGGGIALLGLALAGIPQLRVDNNLKSYHRPTSEFLVHDAVLNEKFGGTNSIIFLVETPSQDGIKDPKMLQGMAALQGFLEGQPHVGKTQSLADLIKRMNQAMHADDPAYYTIPDDRELIAQYLFLYSLSGNPQDFDSFVDNDYQKAAVWAFLKTDSAAYADALARRAREVAAQHFPPGVTVQMGGGLPQIIALNEVITQEKYKNMAQMAVVVFLLSSLALRSFIGGLFVVVPLFTVILANFGLMGWVGMPLDMGAATAASMAIGIGADYEIYLLFRFREELAKSRNLLAATRDSLLTSGKAILFVALSVVGGYAVLQVSDFKWYGQISTLVMATMSISALSALLFLRAMMMVFKPRFAFGNLREALFARPLVVAGGQQ
ncbi:MAG: MMPL family transporter [Nitrospirae bacterium]|nr:MMPL family transporter [Nitrospirota bacterium]